MTAKKKLAGAFGGLVALGATIALTAGTFSYFSDADQQVATVSNGTLQLDVSTPRSVPITLTNAAPGEAGFSTTLHFQNTGSLEGVLRLEIEPTSGTPATFDQNVLVTLDGLTIGDPAKNVNGTNTLAFDVAATDGGLNVSSMSAGRIKSVPITVALSPKAGNELQGVTGSFTIKASLVQGKAGVPSDPALTAPVTAP